MWGGCLLLFATPDMLCGADITQWPFQTSPHGHAVIVDDVVQDFRQ
jgi:hypothetical protein